MSELTTVARPYAKAAFSWAVENNKVSEWAEMLNFVAQVAENEQIESMITSSLNADVLSDFFIKVCGEQLDGKGQNLIRLMADNGRLQLLPKVVSLYRELEDEYLKQIEGNIISAYELTSVQIETIADSLELRLARKVKLNCSIDKSLIGGFIVKADDLVIDASVQGKIKRLAESLQS